jgi:hypothetical protein
MYLFVPKSANAPEQGSARTGGVPEQGSARTGGVPEQSNVVLPPASTNRTLQLLPVTADQITLDFMLPSCDYLSELFLQCDALTERGSIKVPLTDLTGVSLHTAHSVIKAQVAQSQPTFPLAQTYHLAVQIVQSGPILAAALQGPVFLRATFQSHQRPNTVQLQVTCGFLEHGLAEVNVARVSQPLAWSGERIGYAAGDFQLL